MRYLEFVVTIAVPDDTHVVSSTINHELETALRRADYRAAVLQDPRTSIVTVKRLLHIGRSA